MFRMTLLVAILLMFTTAAQSTPDCDKPADAFDAWFTAAHTDLLESGELALMAASEEAELYDNFIGYVFDYVRACAEADSDLAYEGEFDDGEGRLYGNDMLVSVRPMDVNLDGVDDWLLRLHVGPPGGGRTFVRMLYWGDDVWVMQEIWLLATDDRTDIIQSPQPRLVYVHDQADNQGRTYMGIYFYPGIGSEPYVGGLLVLRWHEWEPEEVLFIEQACVFPNWERGSDGGLYIQQSSAIPWQGCTYPNHEPEEGIQIPDAQMPEIAD